jgi:protein CpxP
MTQRQSYSTLVIEKEHSMKKRNFVIGSILAASLLATAGVASARGPGDCAGGRAPVAMRGGEGFGPGSLHGALRGLDLSDQQRDKIFDIVYAQEPAMRNKVKELRRQREELRQASLTSHYDVKRVRELADAQARTIADLEVMRAETSSKIFALLTPEQQQKATNRLTRGYRQGRS